MSGCGPRGGGGRQIAQSSLSLFPLPLLFSHDWPQLQGPHRSGVYTDSDVAWPNRMAWEKEVDAGFAPPVIAGGTVILFRRKGNQ